MYHKSFGYSGLQHIAWMLPKSCVQCFDVTPVYKRIKDLAEKQLSHFDYVSLRHIVDFPSITDVATSM